MTNFQFPTIQYGETSAVIIKIALERLLPPLSPQVLSRLWRNHWQSSNLCVVCQAKYGESDREDVKGTIKAAVDAVLAGFPPS